MARRCPRVGAGKGSAQIKEADLARARLVDVAHARAKALRVQRLRQVSPRMQLGATLEPMCRWCRFEAR
jgi:hypothetical protein